MAQTLPTQLRYLEPVRMQLAGLKPDDIHEGTDLSVLRRVVRKRVKGLTDEDARLALREDAAKLEGWLATSEADARLYFVIPILPDALEILLAEQAQPTPQRGEVSMELPDGAKVTKENGCWSVKWHRFLLFLNPSHCEEMHRYAGQFREDAKARPMVGGNGMSIIDVRFGEVAGIKCVSKIASSKFKRLDYALDVPGGYVVAVLGSFARDFDESEIEPFFHTLKVSNYPESPMKHAAPGG